jgi:hypothetical protein
MSVVHILHEGRSLCMMQGTPNVWPAGHVWVGVADANTDNTKERLSKSGATMCGRCTSMLEHKENSNGKEESGS